MAKDKWDTPFHQPDNCCHYMSFVCHLLGFLGQVYNMSKSNSNQLTCVNRSASYVWSARAFHHFIKFTSENKFRRLFCKTTFMVEMRFIIRCTIQNCFASCGLELPPLSKLCISVGLLWLEPTWAMRIWVLLPRLWRRAKPKHERRRAMGYGKDQDFRLRPKVVWLPSAHG